MINLINRQHINHLGHYILKVEYFLTLIRINCRPDTSMSRKRKLKYNNISIFSELGMLSSLFAITFFFFYLFKKFIY